MKRPALSKSREIAVTKFWLAEFANIGKVDLTKPAADILDQLLVAFKEIDNDYEPIIDHTPDLLARARASRNGNNLSLAVLMYATWVEHTLNQIIFDLAVDRGMLKSHFNIMIREASLRSKSTWLLPLLSGKALSSVTVVRIQKLADARNAFIHYKWGQTLGEAKADQGKALVEAEKLVKSLRRYRSSVIKRVTSRSKSVHRVFADDA